jgi:hypothetical protein
MNKSQMRSDNSNLIQNTSINEPGFIRAQRTYDEYDGDRHYSGITADEIVIRPQDALQLDHSAINKSASNIALDRGDID